VSSLSIGDLVLLRDQYHIVSHSIDFGFVLQFELEIIGKQEDDGEHAM